MDKNMMATRIIEQFFSRQDAYGVYAPRSPGARASVSTAKSAITPEIVVRHLAGKVVLSAHSTSKENTCKWGAFDLDASKDAKSAMLKGDDSIISKEKETLFEQAKKIVAVISEAGLASAIEDSVGGYHIWLLSNGKVPSEAMHALLRSIARKSGVACEIFPKQAVAGEGFGNCLRIPGRYHSSSSFTALCEDGSKTSFVRWNAWEKILATANPAEKILSAASVAKEAEEKELDECDRITHQFCSDGNGSGDVFRKAVLDTLAATPGVCNSYADFVRLTMAFKSADLSYSDVDHVFRASANYNAGRNEKIYRSTKTDRVTFGTAVFYARSANPGLFDEKMREISPKKNIKCRRCGKTCQWGIDHAGKWRLFDGIGFGDPHICISEHAPVQEEKAETESEPELVNLPKKPDITIDLSHCHDFFNLYLEKIGKTEASIQHIATALLVAIGATIGNRTKLNVTHGIRPNIYAVLVGDSTFIRKTTAMVYGIAPLSAISSKKQDVWLEQLEEYEYEIERYEAMSKRERAQSERPARPENLANIYPDEFSPEKLLEHMQSKPDGLFKYSEMGRLLASLDIGYMAGFKEKLTEFYDGIDDKYIRATKSGVIVVKNACPSIIACSTFPWLQAHLKDGDMLSGFLARFVFVAVRNYPTDLVPIPDFFRVNPEFVEFFEKLDVFSCQNIELSEDAKSWYNDWYTKFHAETIQKDRLLHSFLGRLATTTHKLAIINHVLDCIFYGDVPGLIEVRHYERALPWYELFASNIEDCYTELTASPSVSEMKVLGVIRKRGKKIGDEMHLSSSQILMYANMSKKELMETIENLEYKNMARQYKKGKYTYFVTLCE